MSFKPCKVKLGVVGTSSVDCHNLGKRARSLGLTTEATLDEYVLVYDSGTSTSAPLRFDKVSLTELSERLDQYEAEQRRATERLQAAAQPDPMSGGVSNSHYSKMSVQPSDFSVFNGFDSIEFNIIKYTARHAGKDGVKDVDKAIHYLRAHEKYVSLGHLSDWARDKFVMPPSEFIARNDLGYLQGMVIDLVSRRPQGYVKEAIHYLEMIKHYQYGGEK